MITAFAVTQKYGTFCIKPMERFGEYAVREAIQDLIEAIMEKTGWTDIRSEEADPKREIEKKGIHHPMKIVNLSTEIVGLYMFIGTIYVFDI